MNAIFGFTCVAPVPSDAEVFIYTPNIFVRDWGTYLTVIYHNISNFTLRAYNPITNQRGFILRCIHERLRLKRAEKLKIALENYFARIFQDICDDVASNYACSPLNHDICDATSPLSYDSDYSGRWINTSGSN